MVLPLYLAVTGAEMSAFSVIPSPIAYMACTFSPYTQGITNIPDKLPKGSMLVLTDRMPCQGHSADLAAQQLQKIVEQCGCESVLLDFQRPRTPESEVMVQAIVRSLPCPVAVTADYAADLTCPVFLSPAPLHVPLEKHVAPWSGREIWLEAALEQEDIVVTKGGTEFISQFPTAGLTDGFFDEYLCCHYHTKTGPNRITFTLFDTAESLEKKLGLAQSLGVKRAVGLYQELGAFLTGKFYSDRSIAQ